MSTTPFTLFCTYCTPSHPFTMTLVRVDEAEEEVLRSHLTTAHPDVPIGRGVGDLLRHFRVGA